MKDPSRTKLTKERKTLASKKSRAYLIRMEKQEKKESSKFKAAFSSSESKPAALHQVK
jgi:hypothetical protein